MIRRTFVQQFLLSNLTSKWRPNAQGLASYYKHNIQQQKLQGNTYLRLTVTTLHEHAPFTVQNYLSLYVVIFGFYPHSTYNISYHKHITRNNHNNNKNNPAKQIYKSKQSILLQRLNNKQMNKSSKRTTRDSRSKQRVFISNGKRFSKIPKREKFHLQSFP